MATVCASKKLEKAITVATHCGFELFLDSRKPMRILRLIRRQILIYRTLLDNLDVQVRLGFISEVEIYNAQGVDRKYISILLLERSLYNIPLRYVREC